MIRESNCETEQEACGKVPSLSALNESEGKET
jgi:hypothetical protein